MEQYNVKIRKIRRRKKLTQAKLADMVGISLSMLGHIERGTRRPSVATLIQIAKALSISLDDLINGISGSQGLGEAQPRSGAKRP